MKVGLKLRNGEVSWRADDSDDAGILRLAMLRDSVGMDELPDDEAATCRIVSRDELKASVGVPGHGMRMDLSALDEGVVYAAFRDCCRPEELETVRWRGVRKLLYLGLVPGMLRGDFIMVHGALLEKDGRALMLCGPSGIGKSTTSLRMTEHFRILADDCFLLCRDGDGYLAHPLPTWSAYLFGKKALAECDARRSVPVSRLLILGRERACYTELEPKMALLGCANAFTDMVKWHTFRYPPEIFAVLTARALAAAEKLVETLPCGALQLTLDCDIFRLLPDDRKCQSNSQITIQRR